MRVYKTSMTESSPKTQPSLADRNLFLLVVEDIAGTIVGGIRWAAKHVKPEVRLRLASTLGQLPAAAPAH